MEAKSLPAIGSHDYRAYVGPPEKYDLVAAMQFRLLTLLGLRDTHCLLDIGAGSLRAGRLFIPYLKRERYFATEPNKWLVEDGIKNELGNDMILLKNPQFAFIDDFTIPFGAQKFDYILAQSILSHTGPVQFNTLLQSVKHALAPNGIFVATFLKSANVDNTKEGWAYPGCVAYTWLKVVQWAANNELMATQISFRHPNGQTWSLFAHTNAVLDSFVTTLSSNQ